MSTATEKLRVRAPRGTEISCKGWQEISVPEEREERRSRPWNVSLDYSLIRTRPSLDGSVSTPDRQSIRARLGFSPTENWTLTWRTQFDIEEKEFVDQILSLRRDLHRWSATFDFLRASNGNFTFEFRVSLNDLPDLTRQGLRIHVPWV